MSSDSAPRPRSSGYLIGFAVLGAVTLLGFAAPFLPADLAHRLGDALEIVQATPWAPFAAIGAFALLATLGAPQIVLITALVAAFGPWAGLGYSWTGKMIACCIGFAVGRRFGARILARHASARVAELMQQLARRGMLASGIIRLVPTVPSVLVNIAAGATPIRFRDFFIGTAIGSLPKMALMAFGGHAAMVAVQAHSLWAWAALAVILLLWAALAIAGRRWLGRARGEPQS